MKMHNGKTLLVLLCAVLLLLSGCASDPMEQPLPAQPEATRQTPLEQTARWLMNEVPQPASGVIGGEWMMLGLARSGLDIPGEYLEGYRENVASHVASLGGVLHERKYTEYSRVILAWTAIGEDARDVGGYNLLAPLADFDRTVFQGVNGAAFALLALDSGDYEIPRAEPGCVQATRDAYISYLTGAQTSDGGWALTGDTGDIDLTAMTLQALAKYQDRPDVAQSVRRGLELLSRRQNADGSYTEYGVRSSETIAQVIVALTELGISPEDEAFTKNGTTLCQRLLDFRREDGSFLHTLEEGSEPDQMATEQAFYAMAAAERFRSGSSSLYRMRSDAR